MTHSPYLYLEVLIFALFLNHFLKVSYCQLGMQHQSEDMFYQSYFSQLCMINLFVFTERTGKTWKFQMINWSFYTCIGLFSYQFSLCGRLIAPHIDQHHVVCTVLAPVGHTRILYEQLFPDFLHNTAQRTVFKFQKFEKTLILHWISSFQTRAFQPLMDKSFIYVSQLAYLSNRFFFLFCLFSIFKAFFG